MEVNAPSQQIPEEIRNPENLKQLGRALGAYFDQNDFWRFQVFKRLGGATDIVANSKSLSTFIDGPAQARIASLQSELNDLKQLAAIPPEQAAVAQLQKELNDLKQLMAAPIPMSDGLEKRVGNIEHLLAVNTPVSSNLEKRVGNLEQTSNVFPLNSRVSSLEKKDSNLEQLISQLMSAVSGLASALSGLSFKVETVDDDFTTNGNTIVFCNNSSAMTLTLNPSPKDGERVYGSRLNATLTLSSAAGINTSGSATSTTLQVITKYDCPLVVYSAVIGQWVAI